MKARGKRPATLNARALAARALAPVLAGKESLSDTLPPALAQVTATDRGLLQAMAYTTCRHALHYRELLAPLLQRQPQPVIEALLLVGLAQLRDLRIPDHAALSETVEAARELGQERATGLINAILRRYLRERENLEANAGTAAHAHPLWLKTLLEADWGAAEAAQLMAANNQEGPLTLRVNRLKTTRDAYLARLADDNIGTSPCPWSEVGIRVEGVSDVRLLPGFADGHLSVQDEAAQFAAPLLQCQAGMHVLDACAAPGGKSAHLLENYTDIQLTALDIAPERCERIRENLKRLTLEATVLVADAAAPADWWNGQAYDRILLDAPCTATGVIRRHPDIKLLRRENDIQQTVKQQATLLTALWPTLKPGGLLLYATCSTLKAENERQIATFLDKTADAEELPLDVTWGEKRPHGRQLLTGDTDGFYYALLRRRH